MTIEKINDNIYAFRYPGEPDNELHRLFDQWNDTHFLFDFFTQYKDDLAYFNVDSVNVAVDDTLKDADELEYVFLAEKLPDNFVDYIKPLTNTETHELYLSNKKARIYKRDYSSRIRHDCWLRIYLIKLPDDCYVVTGGAIKLTGEMKDRPHTKEELSKIAKCRSYLRENGIYDANGI